jgi:hypothetical protein
LAAARAAFVCFEICARLLGECGGDDEHASPDSHRVSPLNGENRMTRILFVGQKPETVDFSDPSLPPGFDADKINAGIAVAVQNMEERGWQGDMCMITPDEAGRAMLKKALEGASYGCDAVHKAAPSAAIAFNTQPEDTAGAAARQLNAR